MTTKPDYTSWSIPMLIAEADRLLNEAEAAAFDSWAACDRLAMRANKLRTIAVKRMPDGREKLTLLMEILFTADAMEDQDRMVWGVRRAVRCAPSEEQMEDLRDYWVCASWILKGDQSFPLKESPDQANEDQTPRPLPGQMGLWES